MHDGDFFSQCVFLKSSTEILDMYQCFHLLCTNMFCILSLLSYQAYKIVTEDNSLLGTGISLLLYPLFGFVSILSYDIVDNVLTSFEEKRKDFE